MFRQHFYIIIKYTKYKLFKKNNKINLYNKINDKINIKIILKLKLIYNNKNNLVILKIYNFLYFIFSFS